MKLYRTYYYLIRNGRQDGSLWEYRSPSINLMEFEPILIYSNFGIQLNGKRHCDTYGSIRYGRIIDGPPYHRLQPFVEVEQFQIPKTINAIVCDGLTYIWETRKTAIVNELFLA